MDWVERSLIINIVVFFRTCAWCSLIRPSFVKPYEVTKPPWKILKCIWLMSENLHNSVLKQYGTVTTRFICNITGCLTFQRAVSSCLQSPSQRNTYEKWQPRRNIVRFSYTFHLLWWRKGCFLNSEFYTFHFYIVYHVFIWGEYHHLK